jgi:soluble lytic murein transglycosylase-like protein
MADRLSQASDHDENPSNFKERAPIQPEAVRAARSAPARFSGKDGSAGTVFPCYILEMFRTVQFRRFLRRQSRPRLALAAVAAGLCVAGIVVFAILATRKPTVVVAAKPAHEVSHRAVKLESRPLRIVLPAPKPLSPKKPVKTVPSEFDREQAMSHRQLIARWDPDIAQASKRFAVPQTWIRAVLQAESGGRTLLGPNQPIKSSAGALGLMQLMPSTYDDMRKAYRLGPDPFDPQDNITAGTAYLHWLYGKYGYPEMFAAYNDGPGNLEQRLLDEKLLPLETRNYLARVTGVVQVGSGGRGAPVKFTRPDGTPVSIDAGAVTQVRAALPDEYAACVQTVISVGPKRQGVCEDLAKVRAMLRAHGGIILAARNSRAGVR